MSASSIYIRAHVNYQTHIPKMRRKKTRRKQHVQMIRCPTVSETDGMDSITSLMNVFNHHSTMVSIFSSFVLGAALIFPLFLFRRKAPFFRAVVDFESKTSSTFCIMGTNTLSLILFELAPRYGTCEKGEHFLRPCVQDKENPYPHTV